LPSSFDSLISCKYEELAKNINKIDINTLAINSLEANKATKTKNSYKNMNNNKTYCSYCKKTGYIIDKCFIKYPELKTKFNKTSKKDNNNSNN
jgi:hypothetical protein